VSWLGALDHDWHNLRAALRWAESRRDVAAIARLGVALVPFWEVRGYLSEGRRWLDQALAAPASARPRVSRVLASEEHSGSLPLDLRTRALIGAARLAQWQADLDSADALLEESLVLAHELDDQRLIAEAMTWLGTVRRRRGAYVEAERLLTTSLTMHEAHGDASGAAWALCNLGAVAGNLAEQNHDDAAIGGEEPPWVPLLEESLARFRALGDVRFVAIASTLLGANFRSVKDRDRQVRLVEEGLTGFQAVGDRASLLGSLLSLAEQAARSGPPVCAARLLGAAEALRDTLGASLAHVNRVSHEAALRGIEARLAEDEIQAALAEGRTMRLDEVLAEARRGMGFPAVAAAPGDTMPPGPGDGLVRLTTWRQRGATG
jgi:hypothetical protein